MDVKGAFRFSMYFHYFIHPFFSWLGCTFKVGKNILAYTPGKFKQITGPVSPFLFLIIMLAVLSKQGEKWLCFVSLHWWGDEPPPLSNYKVKIPLKKVNSFFPSRTEFHAGLRYRGVTIYIVEHQLTNQQPERPEVSPPGERNISPFPSDPQKRTKFGKRYNTKNGVSDAFSVPSGTNRRQVLQVKAGMEFT